jgi:hypothetical protein
MEVHVNNVNRVPLFLMENLVVGGGNNGEKEDKVYMPRVRL